jgi:hypothetical protein
MEKEQTFLQSLERLWQLCVFQSKPQELRVGAALAAAIIPLYLVGIFASLIIAPGLRLSLAVGTGMVVGALVLITLFLWGLHFYKGTRQDFLATMLAIIGTQCIILFINLPALLFYQQIPANNIAGQMVLGLMVALLGWSLAIIGRILHFSLQISHALGGAIALSWVLVIRAGSLMILS